MATYLVSYNLNKETNRPKIVDEVMASAGFAKLGGSDYAISTVETPSQVHTRFKKHLDENDDFYVITLSGPWTGYGPKNVIDWLEGEIGGGG